ncbi:SgcJ/EcaC family oxidoreductase [Pseudonocardia sp. GCM10023141]|uniref:SgcJ/EcaC family oxidoreductase n=1 Tax=Pseudonocardia sp. GCM10023141 TaxID=3252653 RepID=UPI003611E1F2
MTDDTAIHDLLDLLSDAWARGDGAAYGVLFTADATYVTFVGTVYRGPDDIGSGHQTLFDSFLKGTRLATEVIDIRYPGPDTALVLTRGDTYKGKPGKLGKVQTYTVVRSGSDGWLVAAFQNTRHRPVMEAVSFRMQPASKPHAAG